MGLYIQAYSRCRFVAPYGGNGDYDLYEEKHVRIYATAFPERLDGQPEGWWLPEGDWLHFQAGSYGGYNEWRAQLSRAALGVEPGTVWSDPDEFVGRPFVELINFADNEGAIGPATSAKLAADFEADPTLPDRVGDDPFDWFEGRYDLWLQAFRLAAVDGFVVFR